MWLGRTCLAISGVKVVESCLALSILFSKVFCDGLKSVNIAKIESAPPHTLSHSHPHTHHTQHYKEMPSSLLSA